MVSMKLSAEMLLNHLRNEAVECISNFKTFSDEERDSIYEQAAAVYRFCRIIRDEGMLAAEDVVKPAPLDIIGGYVLNGMDVDLMIELTVNQYDVCKPKHNADAIVWYIALRGVLMGVYQDYIPALQLFFLSMLPEQFHQEYQLKWEQLLPKAKPEPVSELLLKESSPLKAESAEALILEIMEDAILKSGNAELKMLLKESNQTDDIALAWKVMHKNAKEKMMCAMLESEQEQLYEEYSHQGPVRMLDIIHAMAEIVKKLRNVAEN